MDTTPDAGQTLNRYAYALNDPTTRVDPSGLKSQVLDVIGKCTNAIFQFGLEGWTGWTSVELAGTAAATIVEAPPVGAAAAGAAAYNASVFVNNYGFMQESIAWCLGFQSEPPGDEHHGLELPIPKNPFSGLKIGPIILPPFVTPILIP